MWKLTIEDDEGATRELDLVRDGYTIGRDGTCEVYLPERNVSRRHARLERGVEGHWWLIDLGAPYGSFVNGRRVAGRTLLSPGDVVRIGDHWLGLADDERAADADAAGAAGESASGPWDVRNEPDRLLVFDGPDDGLQVRLDAGPVLIGVGEGVTIRLPDDAAPPGVYALVRPLPQGRYEIVRRGDAIGMRVRMQPAERALLYDDDVTRFEAPGGTEVVAMRFLAARRVRHSTTVPSLSELAERAGLGQGWHLDTSALPKLDAIKATLEALPLWWRLEGESVWPRPADYRSPPVRFTDVTMEETPPPAPEAAGAPVPAPEPDATAVGTPPREQVRRRAPRWAAAAAMLLLVGAAWSLGRSWGGTGPAADGAGRAPGASTALLTAAATPSAVAPTPAAPPGNALPPAGVEGAGPSEIAAAEPPAPNRANTLAARSTVPSRIGSPARHAAPSGGGDGAADSPERLRGLCRTYAASVTRGDASPQIVHFYRARCP